MRAHHLIPSSSLPLLLALLTPPVAAAQAPDSLQLGIDHFRAGRYPEARRVLTARAERSRDPRLFFFLGRVAFAERDFEGAVRWLQRSVELRGDDASAHLWLGNAYANAAFAAALPRKPLLGTRARAAWERAAELDPGDPDAHEHLVSYHLTVPSWLGGSAARAEQHARALERAAPLRGGLAAAAVLEHRGEHGPAESRLRTLLVEFPDSVRPLARLVGLLVDRRRVADAFALLDERLAARPGEGAALYLLGRTASRTGERLEAGAAALRAYLALPAASHPYPAARARFWLGGIHERRGDTGAALAEYRAALELQPDDTEARRAAERLARTARARG